MCMIRCTHFHTFYGTYSGYLCILPASRHAPGIARFSFLPRFSFISRMYHVWTPVTLVLDPPSSAAQEGEAKEEGLECRGFLSWQVEEKKHKRQRHTPFALAFATCGGGRQKNPIPSLSRLLLLRRQGRAEEKVESILQSASSLCRREGESPQAGCSRIL